MGWSLIPGSGTLLAITNDTGETVTDVVMRLRGDAIGGRFGRRDWSATTSLMANGESVEAPFRGRAGAADTPRIEITWTNASGAPQQAILRLPI